ncbi:MAG: hypothetical protein ABI605_03310 [Rhizobacter sp.]
MSSRQTMLRVLRTLALVSVHMLATACGGSGGDPGNNSWDGRVDKTFVATASDQVKVSIHCTVDYSVDLRISDEAKFNEAAALLTWAALNVVHDYDSQSLIESPSVLDEPFHQTMLDKANSESQTNGLVTLEVHCLDINPAN